MYLAQEQWATIVNGTGSVLKKQVERDVKAVFHTDGISLKGLFLLALSAPAVA